MRAWDPSLLCVDMCKKLFMNSYFDYYPFNGKTKTRREKKMIIRKFMLFIRN